MPGVIIPRKTIGELTKLLAETDQDVTVSVSENQIRFSFGDVILASRLIDGTYPEYEKVIPLCNRVIAMARPATQEYQNAYGKRNIANKKLDPLSTDNEAV